MATVENFLLMTGTMLPRKKVYKDALNSLIYYCDAVQGTELTDPYWKVMKGHIDSDGDIDEVWSTGGYDNLATDLSVVQALSYS